MVTIRLTEAELNFAYAVARLRVEWAQSVGARHNYGLTPPDSLRAMSVGCVGELAVAKHLRLPWGHTQYDKTANDVGGYEVRATLRGNGCLLTHDSDKPAIYILATVDLEDRLINLRGWELLYETWQPERWGSHLPAPCYMTPQNLLHPMDTLPKAI